MRPGLRRLRSIRGRITAISTALVAITLVAASLVLMEWVQADLLASAQQTLDEALDTQAAQLGFEDFEVLEADVGSVDNFEASVGGSEVFIGLFTGQGDGNAYGEMFIDGFPIANLVIDVDTGEIVEILDIDDAQPIENEVLVEEIGSLAFDVMEVGAVDGDQFLVGAASLDEVEESVAAIRQALMFIVPSLILAFAMLTWWLVGRALRPVMSITDQVEAISASSMDRRVPVPDTNDEVADLASVMNRMLDRLQRGGERQRQFSADASHELRSPLSTVRAAAEILGGSPSKERAKRLSADIVAESDRMDELISDLLELSRLDEDRRAPDREQTDLVELVTKELDAELAVSTFSLDAPDRLDAAVSPRQLRRVVRNLVDNATRHAAKRVRVSLSPSHGRVLLQVEDDGAGVADDAKELIFERFSRLDEARTRDSGGAGLGLALVKAIVESHDGMVEVKDSPLGGALFVVSLPTG